MRHSLFSFRLLALLVVVVGAIGCSRNTTCWKPVLMNDCHWPFGTSYSYKIIRSQFDVALSDKVPFAVPDDGDYAIEDVSDSVETDNNETQEQEYVSIYEKDSVFLGNLGLLTLGMDDPMLRKQALLFRSGKLLFRASEFKNESFVECDDCYLNIPAFVQQVNDGNIQNAKITTISRNSYSFPKELCKRYFGPNTKESIAASLNLDNTDSLDFQIIARADGKPIVVSFIHPSGGRLTLCSAPLLFSNFAVTYDSCRCADLMIDLLLNSGFKSPNADSLLVPINIVSSPSEMTDGYRDYIYESDIDSKPYRTTPITDYSTSDPLLELLGAIAKKVLFILVAVFCVYVLRRRQRAIPLFEGYVNRTADYARQVGLLYLNDGNFSIVLKNRLVIFFKEVEERLHIQPLDEYKVSSNAEILAAAIACPDVDLADFLKMAIDVVNGKTDASEIMLVQYSNILNAMTRALHGENVHDELLALLITYDKKK